MNYFTYFILFLSCHQQITQGTGRRITRQNVNDEKLVPTKAMDDPVGDNKGKQDGENLVKEMLDQKNIMKVNHEDPLMGGNNEMVNIKDDLKANNVVADKVVEAKITDDVDFASIRNNDKMQENNILQQGQMEALRVQEDQDKVEPLLVKPVTRSEEEAINPLTLQADAVKLLPLEAAAQGESMLNDQQNNEDVEDVLKDEIIKEETKEAKELLRDDHVEDELKNAIRMNIQKLLQSGGGDVVQEEARQALKLMSTGHLLMGEAVKKEAKLALMQMVKNFEADKGDSNQIDGNLNLLNDKLENNPKGDTSNTSDLSNDGIFNKSEAARKENNTNDKNSNFNDMGANESEPARVENNQIDDNINIRDISNDETANKSVENNPINENANKRDLSNGEAANESEAARMENNPMGGNSNRRDIFDDKAANESEPARVENNAIDENTNIRDLSNDEAANKSDSARMENKPTNENSNKSNLSNGETVNKNEAVRMENNQMDDNSKKSNLSNDEAANESEAARMENNLINENSNSNDEAANEMRDLLNDDSNMRDLLNGDEANESGSARLENNGENQTDKSDILHGDAVILQKSMDPFRKNMDPLRRNLDDILRGEAVKEKNGRNSFNMDDVLNNPKSNRDLLESIAVEGEEKSFRKTDLLESDAVEGEETAFRKTDQLEGDFLQSNAVEAEEADRILKDQEDSLQSDALLLREQKHLSEQIKNNFLEKDKNDLLRGDAVKVEEDGTKEALNLKNVFDDNFAKLGSHAVKDGLEHKPWPQKTLSDMQEDNDGDDVPDGDAVTDGEGEAGVQINDKSLLNSVNTKIDDINEKLDGLIDLVRNQEKQKIDEKVEDLKLELGVIKEKMLTLESESSGSDDTITSIKSVGSEVDELFNSINKSKGKVKAEIK